MKKMRNGEIVVARGRVSSPTEEWLEWMVYLNGETVNHYPVKADAVRYARRLEKMGYGKVRVVHCPHVAA